MFLLTLQTQQKQRQTQPKPNRDGQNLCVSSAMPPHDDFDRSTDHSAIIKGKRTKRPRSNSPSKPPPAAAATSSSSSATATAPPQAHDDYCNSSIVSPATSSGEIYESTEEEEAMANCLIMLAQGNRFDSERKQNDAAERKYSDGSRKLSEIATTTNKAGFFVYECKTCNRAFPSFQALGGHRASHKKPKMITGEEKSKPVKEIHDHPEETEISTAPTLALQMGSANNRAKVHECSICGAEFSSGQALGGHMRRHRAVIGNQAAVSVETTADSSNGTDEIKQRNVLSLDLNLPAPEDDHHLHGSPKFQFVAFPTPALVDCHY